MSERQGTDEAVAGLPTQRGFAGSPFEQLDERRFLSPWPHLDAVLQLGPGRMVGIGAHRGHREAAAGLELALHTAGSGHSTLFFAPDLPARNAVPNLRIERPTAPTPERIREIVNTRIALRQRPDVVVVDHFALLRPDPPVYEPTSYDPWDDPAEDERDPAVQEADEIGRQLKLLATRHDLAVVVMARITQPFDKTEALTVDSLGLAASLEYDADALLLLRRADDRRVDVHVAKNRTGPAPHQFTADW